MAKISGTIYKNWIGDAPAVGAQVEVYRDRNGDGRSLVLKAVLKADSNGQYLTEVSEDCYVIKFRDPPGAVAEPRYKTRSFCLSAGEQKTSVDAVVINPDLKPPDDCYTEIRDFNTWTRGIEVHEFDGQFEYSYNFYDSSLNIVAHTVDLGPPDDIDSSIDHEWEGGPNDLDLQSVKYVSSSDENGYESYRRACGTQVI